MITTAFSSINELENQSMKQMNKKTMEKKQLVNAFSCVYECIIQCPLYHEAAAVIREVSG